MVNCKFFVKFVYLPYSFRRTKIIMSSKKGGDGCKTWGESQINKRRKKKNQLAQIFKNILGIY